MRKAYAVKPPTSAMKHAGEHVLHGDHLVVGRPQMYFMPRSFARGARGRRGDGRGRGHGSVAVVVLVSVLCSAHRVAFSVHRRCAVEEVVVARQKRRHRGRL
jgi:hypothetical protein